MIRGRGTQRLDVWLSQLLWALAKKEGGQVRVSIMELDEVPDACALSTDYDQANHEYVIEARTGNSEMIVINTEQQWARHDTASPQQETLSGSSSRARTANGSTSPQRSALLSDEQMAQIEQNLIRRAAKRTMEKEEEEANAVRRRPQQ